MKKLLIILDGAGDRACRVLHGKTPLQSAHLPHLNRLAAQGVVGNSTIVPGLAPESDVGVFAVLGFNPLQYHVGRGALETEGFGEQFKTGWLALRANFATTDASGTRIIDRRVGRHLSTTHAKRLEREINHRVKLTGATFVFRATLGHRAVLVIKDQKPLSKRVSNTDPAYTVQPSGLAHAEHSFKPIVLAARPLDASRAAKRGAELLNEFTRNSHAILQASNVNAARNREGLLAANEILCRDAETRIKHPPAAFGKRWTILADMPLEKGIAKLVGMRVTPLGEPTVTPADYRLRAQKTLAALKHFDGVYVHIKGPDLYGHDGDARGKKKCLELIDAHYFAPLLQKLDLANTRVIVTADHATPCEMHGHSADPVPFLAAGGGLPASGLKFNEKNAARGPARRASSLLKTYFKKP